MKKVFLIAAMTLILFGCSSNDNEDNISDRLREETIEVFDGIDISAYDLVSVEKLGYYNDDEDFEYISITDSYELFQTNIDDMSEKFDDHDFSYGGLLTIVLGEAPSLTMRFENGTQSIEVIFYRGYSEGDIFRSVLFLFADGEDIYSMGFNDAFDLEMNNIYNLVNN